MNERVTPVSVWQRLREGLLVNLLLAALFGALLGIVLSSEALMTVSVVSAGALLGPVTVALLVLEYRADMAWERANPQMEGGEGGS